TDACASESGVICLGAFAIESESNDPPALDYATPETRRKPSALSPIAAVLGALVGLFGALMLFCGVAGIVWLVRDWRRGVVPDSGTQAALERQ
ncbi:MAG TPA: hypothetical protein VGQ26_03975, partial [Streptosporangiaceae bacterium]|nr:hypothetical protein [Streptosporangiaceae bacterium]